jgi:hypothetical protein
LLNQAPVTDDVFQAADQYELKEHDRVKPRPASVAVKILRLIVKKFPAQQFAQAVIESMPRHALKKAKGATNLWANCLWPVYAFNSQLPTQVLMKQPRSFKMPLPEFGYFAVEAAQSGCFRVALQPEHTPSPTYIRVPKLGRKQGR